MQNLDIELPRIFLKPDTKPPQFLSRSAIIGKTLKWKPLSDKFPTGGRRLILYVKTGDDPPYLRLFMPHAEADRLHLDYVETRSRTKLTYDQYVKACVPLYKRLLKAYNTKYKTNLRLSIDKKPAVVDLTSVNRLRLPYAIEKLEEAVSTLTLHEGEMRERLFHAWVEFHTIMPRNLPPPLDRELSEIYSQLTAREAQHEGQGKVKSTLYQMRNATAVKIAKRIVDLLKTLNEIERRLEQ